MSNTISSATPPVRYNTVVIEGVSVFYPDAGAKDASSSCCCTVSHFVEHISEPHPSCRTFPASLLRTIPATASATPDCKDEPDSGLYTKSSCSPEVPSRLN